MTSDSQISEREREILCLVATGATNQQIAQQLNISANTVKVHLRNIFGKIGAASRTEATLYAVRTGLVRVGEIAIPVALGELNVESPAHAAPAAVAALPPESLSSTVAAADPPSAIVHAVAEPDRAEQIDNRLAPVAIEAPEAMPAPGLRRRWVLVGLLVVLLAVAAVVFVITRQAPASQPDTTPTTVAAALPAPAERWRELPPMPAGRTGFALATYNKDGASHLYAIGGDVDGAVSSEVVSYNATANVWVRWDSKPTAVGDVQAAVVGNTIYVPGGRLGDGQITTVFEAYNPQNNRWTTLKPLPQPRSGYGLAAVEGKLYLFGGWDGTTYRAEVWQYNPDQDTWSERTPMPTARAYAGAAALDGQIYVVGGEGKSGALTVNERYSPSNDSAGGTPWATQQPLLAPRSHVAAVAANGRLFVIGGADANSSLFVYSNTWQSQPIPLGALSDLRAQIAGDKLYIVGGQSNGKASARIYEYQAFYTVMLPLGQPAAP
jgi:DNA-binding CsgD family transcriptional regulator